jgi:hypothetical protein
VGSDLVNRELVAYDRVLVADKLRVDIHFLCLRTDQLHKIRKSKTQNRSVEDMIRGNPLSSIQIQFVAVNRTLRGEIYFVSSSSFLVAECPSNGSINTSPEIHFHGDISSITPGTQNEPSSYKNLTSGSWR